MHVVAVILLVFLLRVLSKQVVVRADVGVGGHHRDHGVEQNLEVGLGVALGVNGERGGEVTTGREAHDAHIFCVDLPCPGVTSHRAHGLFGIAHRHLVVAVGHAILEHHDGNAEVVEEGSPLCAFMFHGEVLVSSSRADYHGASCGFLLVGQEHLQFCHVVQLVLVGGLAFPQFHVKMLLCHCRERHHQGCQYK